MKRLNFATKILIITALVIGCILMINHLYPDLKLRSGETRVTIPGAHPNLFESYWGPYK